MDRVETTSTVFLGLTLGCARCHNHKYDPFTQKEFYQFFAYFNNVPENGPRHEVRQFAAADAGAHAPRSRRELAELDAQDRAPQREARSIRPQPAWNERRSTGWPASAMQTLVPVTFEHADGMPVRRAASAKPRHSTASDVRGRRRRPFDIDDHFTLAGLDQARIALNGAIVTRMADRRAGQGLRHLLARRAGSMSTSPATTPTTRFASKPNEVIEPRTLDHIAVTYDGSRMAEGIKLYIDGKPAKIKVAQDTLYRPFRNAGSSYNEPLRIGAGGGEANRFEGADRRRACLCARAATDEVAALARRVARQSRCRAALPRSR